MIHSVDICPPVVLCCVSSGHSNQKKNEYFYSAFNYKQRQKCQLAHLCETAFFFEKKKLHVFVLFSTKDLSYFSAKNTILFSQQAQIPTEAGHLFCRHFSFVQRRVNDKHLGCGFKKNKLYIFLLPASQINTTTYSGKGNESNPFAEHATACGTCKHQIQVFSAGSNLQQNCFFGEEYVRSVEV